MSDDKERYLKQLKAHNTDLIYGANNLRIKQTDDFLGFEVLDFTREKLILKDVQIVEKMKEEGQLIATIKDLRHEQNKTQQQIAKELVRQR